MANYELTNTIREYEGVILHRIKATKNFTVAGGREVLKGELGGWIQSTNNLSGNAWVTEHAIVMGNALVYGYALITDYAIVNNEAMVYGFAIIGGYTIIENHAKVYGYVVTKGSPRIGGHADLSGRVGVGDSAHIEGYVTIGDEVVIAGSAHILGRVILRDRVYVGGNAILRDRVVASGDVRILDDAEVFGEAILKDHVIVDKKGRVFDRAEVTEHAHITGRASVSTTSRIKGDVVLRDEVIFRGATISSNQDFIVFKDRWSHKKKMVDVSKDARKVIMQVKNRPQQYFVWTKSNNGWSSGTFRGSASELIQYGYDISDECGKGYESFVKVICDAYGMKMPKIPRKPKFGHNVVLPKKK